MSAHHARNHHDIELRTNWTPFRYAELVWAACISPNMPPSAWLYKVAIVLTPFLVLLTLVFIDALQLINHFCLFTFNPDSTGLYGHSLQATMNADTARLWGNLQDNLKLGGLLNLTIWGLILFQYARPAIFGLTSMAIADDIAEFKEIAPYEALKAQGPLTLSQEGLFGVQNSEEALSWEAVRQIDFVGSFIVFILSSQSHNIVCPLIISKHSIPSMTLFLDLLRQYKPKEVREATQRANRSHKSTLPQVDASSLIQI